MNQQVYDIAKTLHIVGISVAAGTSLIDLILLQYFWNIYRFRIQEGVVIERLVGRLQRVAAVGLMLIVLSGVTMMFYLHTVWGPQLWFRIKMGVLLLIIINGLSFRRVLGKRIHARVMQESTVRWTQQGSLRSGVTVVQLMQLVFFLVIFVLSVFRFN
ncbi:hypothetical protein [Parachryseolinea silvisoli]|uniref:hypothetical protein n=1 Tax=Parachryseolinea silvisoli TaxID=2873601 RepID=UPI002265BF05|nr:hypothetical protein [Parachryseolinea silvisoli]MCD9019938.1 hypothetical protein [Parachryseolinea silvisoli]